jgi:hypothetical protein
VALTTAGFLGTALVVGLDLNWGKAAAAALLASIAAFLVAGSAAFTRRDILK